MQITAAVKEILKIAQQDLGFTLNVGFTSESNIHFA